MITGSFGHQLITNDGSGNAIETDTPYGADQLDVSAILDDTGNAPTVTFTGDSFSFSRNNADEAYRLSVRPQQESAIATETQDVGTSLELWSPYFGRIQRSGVSRATLITFDVGSAAVAPNHAYVASTGIRTFSAMAVGSGAVLDWDTAGALFGANAVLSAADGDELWDTTYAETTVAGSDGGTYWSIIGALHTMVTLTNGTPFTVTGTIEPTPSDRCVVLDLPRQTELARVLAANGFGSNESGTAAWNIVSTPRADLSPAAGITIAFPQANVSTDALLTVNYANPYPEDQVTTLSATYKRTAMLGSASAALTYGTTQFAVVPTMSASSCAMVSADATIAMASIPTFGGTTLDTDGATVSIDRSGLVELDFAPTTGGSADDWLIVLDEATPSGAVLSFTELHVYSTLQASVLIDPSLLVAGHSYMFEMESRLGYPNAASRDYRTISYPFGTGVTYSSVFVVGN